MTAERLVARAQLLLKHVEFLDYKFHVAILDGCVSMWGSYIEPDTYTGKNETQFTRKWLLTTFMTDSEIVQTAFKLCLTSMEHRTREAFKYKGARIFGPHFSVDDLVRLCHSGRENAGGRQS